MLEVYGDQEVIHRDVVDWLEQQGLTTTCEPDTDDHAQPEKTSRWQRDDALSSNGSWITRARGYIQIHSYKLLIRDAMPDVLDLHSYPTSSLCSPTAAWSSRARG